MNIDTELTKLFDIPSIKISETIKIMRAVFECPFDKLPCADKIWEFKNSLPDRDDTVIELNSDLIKPLVFAKIQNREKDEEINFYNEYFVPGQNITVTIHIDKPIIDNTITIYNFEKFYQIFYTLSKINIINLFTEYLMGRDSLHFELLDSNFSLATKTITFGKPNMMYPNTQFNRQKHHDICKQSSCFYNAVNCTLIPEDFIVESYNEENGIYNIFNELATLFSIVYLGSSSSINGDILNVQFMGQRGASHDYRINNIEFKNHNLVNIYKWIYTDGNTVDKATIARNVISLHCQYVDILNTDEKSFSSIQSNFALYQKEHVAKYIELKNKLSKFIVDLVKETTEIIVGYSDRVKNNLIALATFLFSVVIANMVSSNSLDDIFTSDMKKILTIVLGGSIFYLLLSLHEVYIKVTKIESGYNELKNNYSDILDADDIATTFGEDELLKNNKKQVKHYTFLYSTIWILFIILGFIVIRVWF